MNFVRRIGFMCTRTFRWREQPEAGAQHSNLLFIDVFSGSLALFHSRCARFFATSAEMTDDGSIVSEVSDARDACDSRVAAQVRLRERLQQGEGRSTTSTTASV